MQITAPKVDGNIRRLRAGKRVIKSREETSEMNLEPMQKAAVLIEALPYIQRFNRKIVVVKYGGSAMVDEELKRKVIQDVALLKLI